MAAVLHQRLIPLPGGTCTIGDDVHPEERPVRTVEVVPFAISATAVTNAEFAAFVAAAAHITSAERYGWSFVFAGLLPDDFEETAGVAAAPWWRQVHGATWDHPFGPQSSLAGREEHPVTHVSRVDAEAYAAWAGVRLPTEPEWEYAARGGLAGAQFPWGDELEPDGQPRMNVWHGPFPTAPTAGTCPAGAYAPNGFGLHNITGNVWEWCAGSFTPGGDDAVSRGGSYLCHASYCRRYRVAARQAGHPEDSTGNVGFRVAADHADATRPPRAPAASSSSGQSDHAHTR